MLAAPVASGLPLDDVAAALRYLSLRLPRDWFFFGGTQGPGNRQRCIGGGRGERRPRSALAPTTLVCSQRLAKSVVLLRHPATNCVGTDWATAGTGPTTLQGRFQRRRPGGRFTWPPMPCLRRLRQERARGAGDNDTSCRDLGLVTASIAGSSLHRPHGPSGRASSRLGWAQVIIFARAWTIRFDPDCTWRLAWQC